MRVLIVDDHRIVRDGLRWMLAGEPGIEIVGEAANGLEFLEMLESVSPDVTLLDVRMPTMGGIEALERLGDTKTEILMLSMHDDVALVRRAIELGASGYLLKSTSRDELIRALSLVASGRPYMQGELTAPLVEDLATGGSQRADGLEARERSVLQLVADGYENPDIAARLGVPETTVRSSLRTIFRALGAQTRSEAVAVGLRLGIIS